MVRVSSPAKLRPWSELTAKMVMGVVPGLPKKVHVFFIFIESVHFRNAPFQAGV